VCVKILALPSLKVLHKEPIGGGFDFLSFTIPAFNQLTPIFSLEAIIPRSVLFVSFEGVHYLLCGLGDGQLWTFLFDEQSGSLHDAKKIALGTQPVILTPFATSKASNVFASSDRPTVIYSMNKKLLYSNVNIKEVRTITPLNSGAFPDSIAIASHDALTIGCLSLSSFMILAQTTK